MEAPQTIWMWIVVFLVALSGCAVTGPGPTDSGFSEASRSLAASRTAVYTFNAAWYPNTLLGSMDSFHAKFSSGRVFVSPERLTFALFDEATNSFLLAYDVNHSDVRWITIKEHGVSRILRIQSGSSVNSFLFTDGATIDGKFISKDDLVKYLLSRYPTE